MRRCVLSALLAGAVVTAMSARARAVIYFEENFNNLSAGALASNQASTGGTWSVSTSGGNDAVNVIADPTGSGRGNVLEIYSPDSSYAATATALLTNAVSGPVQIHFDFYLPRLTSTNELAIFLQNSSGSRLMYNRASLPSSGSGGDGTYQDYDNSTLHPATWSSVLKASTWYTATLTLPDPATGTSSSTMHINIQDGSGNVVVNGDGPLYSSNIHNQNYDRLAFGQSSKSVDVKPYIDNVKITTVPEPASLGLLGMSGLLLLRRRRGK